MWQSVWKSGTSVWDKETWVHRNILTKYATKDGTEAEEESLILSCWNLEEDFVLFFLHEIKPALHLMPMFH